MYTKDDVLNSVNIALTDEHLSDINMGQADVYHDVYRDQIMVALGLDGNPRRFTVTVAEAAPRSDSWLHGRFIQTYTGGRFDLDDPQPEQVSIEDIAHALSLICRYTGHVRVPYSVASHCILVSRILEDAGHSPETVYAGLLHDSQEAYIQDISSPLKGMLHDYKAIEANVSEAVYEALELDGALVDWEAVKWADLCALFIERRDLMREATEKWADEEFAEQIENVPFVARGDLYWRDVKAGYLARYRELRREVGLNA